MKRKAYKCKLLTDVVNTSNSATEGFHRSLDYISGAKFLGIAASSLYDLEQTERTLDIFHNGKVQFGDAHPLFEGNKTYKVPASWCYRKGNDLTDTIYLHHYLTNENRKMLIANGIQLKQARIGYFSMESKKLIDVRQNFSLKSAYNRNERRSKDGMMFGYFGLQKGTDWGFNVDFEDEKYIGQIDKALVGKKRIGRSRSAEYGLIEISILDEIEMQQSDIYIGEVYLYAESNLCFLDKYGKNTLTPEAEQLNLPEGSNIIWEKSQLRTRLYQSWNTTRYNRNEDKLIIEKGSVFSIQLNQAINSSIFTKGVGILRSEGFGKLLINPNFLLSFNEKLNFQFQKHNLTSTPYYQIENGKNDNIILEYLEAKEKALNNEHDIDKKVNEFIKIFGHKFKKGISSSQWGRVRNYAKYAANWDVLKKLLFNDKIGFFYRGQTEYIWRENGRRKILESYIFDGNDIPKGLEIEFVIKLSSEMVKSN